MKRNSIEIRIKSFGEYSVERFSEVLNVQHHYSTFLLIEEFYLKMSSSNSNAKNKFKINMSLFIDESKEDVKR